jgi:tRNA threonylcarbamoyladenosine biosynthesis protein TsaE
MNAGSSNRPEAVEREFLTRSADQTMALGRALGCALKNHLALLLFGGLGSGKTAFVQGLAVGLGVPDTVAVTSPTYTLVNEYPGRLSLFHVDLYRLPSPADPDEIGLLEMFEENGIVAVEWAERLHAGDRPLPRLELIFTAIGDSTRLIRIIAYGLDLLDLLKDIDV